MIKTSLKALAAVAALVAVSPASAATYTYTMTNNDVLAINTDTQSATFKGAAIDAAMTSADFASFTGGLAPTFTATLASLTGTRIINGVSYTPNPGHVYMLKLMGSTVNLWSLWGPGPQGGDYVTTIQNYSAVPEPGMVGLLGASVAGLAFARRRRKTVAA